MSPEPRRSLLAIALSCVLLFTPVHYTSAAPKDNEIEAAVQRYLQAHIEELTDQIRNKTEAEWSQKFERYKQETEARLEHLEHATSHRSRSRRDLNGLMR